MPLTSITTDPESLTMTVTAEFDVPVQRLWDAYLDPRQIEQFWGPPTFPAIFVRHDAFPGGFSHYCMTGPAGERSCGYWEWVSVDAPQSFTVRDGFMNDDGTPNLQMPSILMTFSFSSLGVGSGLHTTGTFSSLGELEQLKSMGMEEGTRAAMSQIDSVVTDAHTYSSSRKTVLQVLNDKQVRITRVLHADVDRVWQAHTEPEVLRRWQLGSDGWNMVVCDVPTEVGVNLRYEWQEESTGDRFGFTGTVLEVASPHRLVSTERMVTPNDPDGAKSPETHNELTLTACEEGTRVVYVITYPDPEIRDQILATGMVEGMELGFARLDRQLLD